MTARDNPDLLLGKAYAAIGPTCIPVDYFVLERWRHAPGRPTAPRAARR